MRGILVFNSVSCGNKLVNDTKRKKRKKSLRRPQEYTFQSQTRLSAPTLEQGGGEGRQSHFTTLGMPDVGNWAPQRRSHCTTSGIPDVGGSAPEPFHQVGAFAREIQQAYHHNPMFHDVDCTVKFKKAIWCMDAWQQDCDPKLPFLQNTISKLVMLRP
eukprot:1140225-Pelagomonas_calceolata.AAC.2